MGASLRATWMSLCGLLKEETLMFRPAPMCSILSWSSSSKYRSSPAEHQLGFQLEAAYLRSDGSGLPSGMCC